MFRPCKWTIMGLFVEPVRWLYNRSFVEGGAGGDEISSYIISYTNPTRYYIIFISSWCGTNTKKIRSKLVDIVTAGSQKITLWGPQRTPLGILRVKRAIHGSDLQPWYSVVLCGQFFSKIHRAVSVTAIKLMSLHSNFGLQCFSFFLRHPQVRTCFFFQFFLLLHRAFW